MNRFLSFRPAFRNRKLLSGIILLLFLLFVALAGPSLCGNPPDYLHDDMLHAPSPQYPFGTDGVGYDVFTMVVYGTRTSLKVGVVVALLSSVIGVAVGGISGYLGGAVDKIICEFLNVSMMIPTFFLIVLAISIYGSSIDHMILIMALTNWPGSARLMRGQAIAIREKSYIKNAEVLGESKAKIILTHIIPNCIFTVIVNLTMTVSAAILSEAGLSFLGLGDPNVVSWGKIISSGRRYLPNCWWICAFPGFSIILTSLSFHLIGDGINMAINAKAGEL